LIYIYSKWGEKKFNIRDKRKKFDQYEIKIRIIILQIKNDGHNLICKIKRKINQLLIELIFLIDFIFFDS
jgi:hypothetical protein